MVVEERTAPYLMRRDVGGRVPYSEATPPLPLVVVIVIVAVILLLGVVFLLGATLVFTRREAKTAKTELRKELLFFGLL